MAYANIRSDIKSQLRRGLAIIETAIVILLVLWIVFGILEYGWMLMKAQEINGAVRHGARTGAVLDAQHQDVIDAVDEAMDRAGLTGMYSIVTMPRNLNTIEPGGTFTVIVRLNYNVTPGVSLRLPVPRPSTIQARVTMVKEGF